MQKGRPAPVQPANGPAHLRKQRLGPMRPYRTPSRHTERKIRISDLDGLLQVTTPLGDKPFEAPN